MSTEMVLAGLPEETVLAVPIAQEDLAEDISSLAPPEPFDRSVSFLIPNIEAQRIWPAALEIQSHGVRPCDMCDTGPVSATSALPTIDTWQVPPGKRLRIFKTVLIGAVSMNNSELVKTLSDLFFNYATDQFNITYDPERYEKKIVNFQRDIQRLLLNTPRIEGIEKQIKKNMEIIDKYNSSFDNRESAIETFRDLVNYADLLLVDYDFIASYRIYDGDIFGLNEVPLKIYSRGQAEYDAIKRDKPDTNWSISWFEGSPIQTYSKAQSDDFEAKGNDGREFLPGWEPTVVNCLSTNKEAFEYLFERGYTVIDVLDNSCETLTDKIEEYEIVRKVLIRRMRDVEKQMIKDQNLRRMRYITEKKDLHAKYHTSSKSRKELNDLIQNEKKASENFKKFKDEVISLVKKKNKLIPQLDKFREQVKNSCRSKKLPNPDPEGGKKTRRVGFKMTAKKGIGSTMKKTRNKKIKRLRLKKGRKTKKYFFKK